jgi:hypothetical protein
MDTAPSSRSGRDAPSAIPPARPDRVHRHSCADAHDPSRPSLNPITEVHTRTSTLSRGGLACLLVLASAVLSLPGCQTARLPLPETLSTAERMPVSGRQGFRIKQRLRFGPYQAHRVTRSGTQGRDRGTTETARETERRQTYAFTLREGEQDYLYVACHASLARVLIETGVIDLHPADESALYCNLQPLDDASAAWELDLRETLGRPLAGTLSYRDVRIDVAGTNRLERGLPMGSTTGYDFRDGDEAVGAVEVINSGAVWLGENLGPERRRLLAASAAALLLHEDLRESLESL